MRLTTHNTGARSRLLVCLFMAGLVWVTLGDALASAEIPNHSTQEISLNGDPVTLTGEPGTGGVDNLEGDDDGDPIDVDHIIMTGTQLLLSVLRVLT